MEFFIMDKDILTQEDIMLWQIKFDQNRQLAVNNKQPDDRILSICGDLLLLKALQNLQITDFTVKHDVHGKPYLENNPIFFNISHKGTKAVCVTNDKPIGVDIENIKPFEKRKAQRICTANELIYIGNNEERFAKVWTVKEAYSKLDGRGISMGLWSIITDMDNNTVNNKQFLLKKFDNYVCAVVF